MCVVCAEMWHGGGGGEGSRMKHQRKAQSSLVCCHGSYFMAMPKAAGQQGHGSQVGDRAWDWRETTGF